MKNVLDVSKFQYPHGSSRVDKEMILMINSIIHHFQGITEKTGMGSRRFELLTSAMSRRRHNQLDHEPDGKLHHCTATVAGC